jgi:hypothetical protein
MSGKSESELGGLQLCALWCHSFGRVLPAGGPLLFVVRCDLVGHAGSEGVKGESGDSASVLGSGSLLCPGVTDGVSSDCMHNCTFGVHVKGLWDVCRQCCNVFQVLLHVFRCLLDDAVIGSPHRLNSEFAFYMHSKQYPNVTTHFRILFHIFAAYFASSQLTRTSEAHFGNFGPISDLRSLFRKLRIYFGPPKFISETSHL